MTFSLEEASLNIYNAKTREYFQEVLSSYASGSYRSAIVMLYSVAICDIIYKLRELDELYSDETAGKILAQVKKWQEERPTSPEWESRLVEEVHKRTNLLETSDYQNLINLQGHRHLSAHPVLQEDFELYNPNRETARSHIRNILEGLLLKPPIFAQKIIQTLVEDLAGIKDKITDKEGLSRYLESKYFKNMIPDVQDKTFRSLWKFVFRLTDPPAKENRKINYQALTILFDKNRERFIKLIKSESAYYSNISRATMRLIRFLAGEGRIYAALDNSARELIIQRAKKDSGPYMIAWYITGDMGAHIEKLISDSKAAKLLGLDYDEANYFYELALEHGCGEKALDLFIVDFGSAPSFDNANLCFSELIEPFLQNFNKNQFIQLIECINKNNQLHGRTRARRDNTKIKKYADTILGEGFDYSRYEDFEFSEE